MLVLELSQTRIKSWSGYKNAGWLPERLAWMQPDAGKALVKMQEASGWRMQFTDAFRSTLFQIQCINGAADERKKRLYAPATKSGHNFGWSVDVALTETLAAFAGSGVPELVVASHDRNALARWMKQFGWTGIKNESWHFDYLGSFETILKRIDATYEKAMCPDNKDVQRCLNKLLNINLEADGDLGPRTHVQMLRADEILGCQDRGSGSAWWRRLLAGATAEIRPVGA
jgi:hypothetical protein